eukprot:984791-Pelagomonas_calceolata.AAC.1
MSMHKEALDFLACWDPACLPATSKGTFKIFCPTLVFINTFTLKHTCRRGVPDGVLPACQQINRHTQHHLDSAIITSFYIERAHPQIHL